MEEGVYDEMRFETVSRHTEPGDSQRADKHSGISLSEASMCLVGCTSVMWCTQDCVIPRRSFEVKPGQGSRAHMCIARH